MPEARKKRDSRGRRRTAGRRSPGRLAAAGKRAAAGGGAALRPLWVCPKCGNRFVTRNMWHSCVVVDLATHFRGKPPRTRRLFDAWAAYVEQFGPFRVIPQKTRICFQTRVRFAGAIVRRDHVQCSFWLTRRVAKLPDVLDERVEHIPPKYYLYRFDLSDPRQLRSRGLRAMLRECYALGLQQEVARRRAGG